VWPRAGGPQWAADGPWTLSGPASRRGGVGRLVDNPSAARTGGPVTFPGTPGDVSPPLAAGLRPLTPHHPLNKGQRRRMCPAAPHPQHFTGGFPPFNGGEFRGGRGGSTREPTGLPPTGGERLDARREFSAHAPPSPLSPQPTSPPSVDPGTFGDGTDGGEAAACAAGYPRDNTPAALSQ